jgi:hypothetical protein
MKVTRKTVEKMEKSEKKDERIIKNNILYFWYKSHQSNSLAAGALSQTLMGDHSRPLEAGIEIWFNQNPRTKYLLSRCSG